MIPESWLRTLYEHRGDYYVLVLPGAIFLVDSPPELERLYGIENAKEAVLRLFVNPRDAERFRDLNGNHDAHIARVTLVGLFNMLPRINSLSEKQFNAPVRIDVTTLDSDNYPRAIDTLHSTYELLS